MGKENKMKKSKMWALIGAIIASVDAVNGIISSIISHKVATEAIYQQMQNSSTYSSMTLNSFMQMINIMQVMILIIAFILIAVELLFYWLAYAKIDKKKGRGWSTFLLVMGIIGLSGVLISLLGTLSPSTQRMFAIAPIYIVFFILGMLLAVGEGVSFIMAYVSKRKEIKESA